MIFFLLFIIVHTYAKKHKGHPMKKFTILLSILALTACGGGSSGNHTTTINQNDSVTMPDDNSNNNDNNNQGNDTTNQNDDDNNQNNNNTPEDLTLGNMDIPTSNISGDVVDSNEQVTNMDSGITNIVEMTAAVEGVIGSDALDDIANNLENLTGTMTRSFKSMNGNYTNKEKAAYVALEGAKAFKDWANDKKSRFFEIYPNIVSYWGKLFCGCNVNGFDINQYLDLFGNNTNQDNFNDFYGQHHYTETNMNNVEFSWADEGFGGKMKFIVDENTGEITGIHMPPDEEDLAEDPNDTGILFTRTNENAFSGEVEHGSSTLSYASVAKRDNLGLRYSDFGLITINAEHIGQSGELIIPFIGGYETKKINPENINTTMVFNGRAVGSVTSVRYGANSGIVLNLDTSNNTNENDKIATLSFENGTSTINAKFDNWYDIKHVKSNNDEYIEFRNYTNDEERANDFRMVSDSGAETFELRNHQYQEYEEGEPTEEIGNTLNSDIRYYGDNNNPTEAVGLIQIRDKGTAESNYENLHYGDNEHPSPEVRMNLGFGGTHN